jgi:hypothetical protein
MILERLEKSKSMEQNAGRYKVHTLQRSKVKVTFPNLILRSSICVFVIFMLFHSLYDFHFNGYIMSAHEYKNSSKFSISCFQTFLHFFLSKIMLQYKLFMTFKNLLVRMTPYL